MLVHASAETAVFVCQVSSTLGAVRGVLAGLPPLELEPQLTDLRLSPTSLRGLSLLRE